MEQVRFLHLDDQSNRVSWIPRQLTSWLWQRHRDKLASYPIVDEGDDESVFKISVAFLGRPVLVTYEIVEDTELFWEKVGLGSNISGILLDQLVKDDQHAGSNIFKSLQEKHPDLVDRTLLLTAYPMETCGQLGWSMPHRQLLTKPPAQEEVLKWLTRHGFGGVISP